MANTLRDLEVGTHVLVRTDATQSPPQPPYNVDYKFVEGGERSFRMILGSKPKTVSLSSLMVFFQEAEVTRRKIFAKTYKRYFSWHVIVHFHSFLNEDFELCTIGWDAHVLVLWETSRWIYHVSATSEFNEPASVLMKVLNQEDQSIHLCFENCSAEFANSAETQTTCY